MPRLSKDDAELALEALKIAINLENRTNTTKAYRMLQVHNRLKTRLTCTEKNEVIDSARPTVRIRNPDE
jgi:hypothetical protein